MKCLTICQPYAELIMTGEKLVENRTWPTKCRGDLLIHAGKSKKWFEEGEDPDDYVLGAIVGRCRLVDCVPISSLYGPHPHLRGHEHASGPWCWVLKKATRIVDPFAYRGRQGLFEVPDQLLEHVKWAEGESDE